MKTSSTFLFVSAFCLLAGQTLFSAVPLDLTAWDASPRLWKTTADGLYGKDPAGFAILADEPLAIEQTVTARFRIEDDAGDGWGTAGIALVDDAHNFWHLALVRAPKDAGRGHFFELTEMYKGEWLSQQKLEIDHREGNGTWKVGDTLTFKLVNDGEGILGKITDPDGKILFNSHYRFTAPASTRGRPAVHLTGGMKGTLMEMTLTGRKPLPPEPKAVVPYQSDAYVEGIRDTATGFFRVVRKPDGRWWTIDPLGRGVVVLGVDHVTFHGHWCETLKQHPHLLKNQK